MKIKNTSAGTRGLHTTAGLVWLEPGQEAEHDVTKAEAESAKATGHFEMSGAPKADPKSDDKG